MKQMTPRRSAMRVQFKPRNPLVAAARLRHAGPHGSARKRERQSARRELRGALHEMHEGP